MFVAQVKDRPNTFYVDKKSFDEITANATHHLINNRDENLSASNEVQKSSTPESALWTPTMNFNEHKMEKAGGQKINLQGINLKAKKAADDSPLVMPACAWELI